MLWAGLRFSDAQRILISSVQLDDTSVRGWCWRSKTSATGFPWGCLLGGMWGRMFAADLLEVKRGDPERDFLLGHVGGVWSYCCLLQYTSLERSEVGVYRCTA